MLGTACLRCCICRCSDLRRAAAISCARRADSYSWRAIKTASVGARKSKQAYEPRSRVGISTMLLARVQVTFGAAKARLSELSVADLTVGTSAFCLQCCACGGRPDAGSRAPSSASPRSRRVSWRSGRARHAAACFAHRVELRQASPPHADAHVPLTLSQTSPPPSGPPAQRSMRHDARSTVLHAAAMLRAGSASGRRGLV